MIILNLINMFYNSIKKQLVCVVHVLLIYSYDYL